MTCVHDLHLKPISHSVVVSIQGTASQLNDEDELMLNVLRCHLIY